MSISRNEPSSSTETIMKALDVKLAAAMRAQEKFEDRARVLNEQLEKDPSNKELKLELASTHYLAEAYEHESDVIASHMFGMMR